MLLSDDALALDDKRPRHRQVPTPICILLAQIEAEHAEVDLLYIRRHQEL